MLVHFPLALVLTGAAALGLARLVALEHRARTLAIVGTWNLCLGAIAIVFALGTGLAAVIDLNVADAARHAIGIHVKWAVGASLGVILLAVWRGAGNAQDERPSAAFLMLLAVVTAVLIMTGYRGGQNVYRYGVGVGPSSARDGAEAGVR
jgi:uncharacterized membrane protein